MGYFYMKTCIRCGEEKEFSEYYKHKRMGDGYLGRCKECHKSEMRRNRSENLEYYRNYDAYRFQNDPKVKERHKRYQATDAGNDAMNRARKKFISENPEKRAAHNQVKNAVRRGDLEKPNYCPKCLSVKPSRQIHAHHEDYSKPLDVVWMCAQCHSDHHLNL